ncbi:MAG: alginate lyase family protein [Anaerolineae bacterium]|jgi:hypothetical protein|nr:alginate lyase family protein [Anaerolineae bacterium]
MNRLTKAIKILRQLGLKQASLFALYKVGLQLGYFERVLPDQPEVNDELFFRPLMPLPDKEEILALLGEAGLAALLVEVDRIVEKGEYRQFGGNFVPIHLKPPVEGKLLDWTAYETGDATVNTEDIKFVWEPARFGWAVPLARAYHLTSDWKYAETFWSALDEFQRENPAYKGPNWQSGQEVAIRLVTVLLCASVFFQNDNTAHSHRKMLTRFVVEHATRIPPTLVYARAQHNNHLITEALGLLCAGFALPEHPEAVEWQKLGYRWLVKAFNSQITDTGEYVQYSNNYHRVMLQCAQLATSILTQNEQSWPEDVLKQLEAAVRWMAEQIDTISGSVANYGHNDGAYLFPLANGGYHDYRPLVQSAVRQFFKLSFFERGPWDEMGLWLALQPAEGIRMPVESMSKVTPGDQTWAGLRAHIYRSRPGHADQNHVDLWWQGEPVALDAGTYRYSAVSPWENQLMTTAVHNTILIDGQDQMTRAGKFLWLDWSNGKVVKENNNQLVGYHNGYNQQGVIHKRVVAYKGKGHWGVEDELISRYVSDQNQHQIQLHWLLPDWGWSIDGTALSLHREEKKVTLSISVEDGVVPMILLCREGKVIYGTGECIPQLGWVSPTYAVKEAALSFLCRFHSHLPVRLTSNWFLSEIHH